MKIRLKSSWILQASSAALILIAALSPIPAKAVATSPTPSCVGNACTLTYTYNTDFYSWTVPLGTTSITFTVRGGAGGKGCWQGFSRGGYGAVVTGTQAVTAGDVLNIAVGNYGTDAYVGGAGVCTTSGTAASGSPGTNAFGSNGGATAEQHPTAKGGGGGAASEIRLNGTGLANRLIVAAGGGGAGGNNGTDKNRGGDASGNTGESGYGNLVLGATNTGKGATISAVGAGGSSGGFAGVGVVGGATYGGGGSGGGGYYGGGGGYYDGGGAGSSWVSNATGVTFAAGTSYIQGSVVINYTYTPPQATTTTISVAGNATNLVKGQNIVITITTTSTPGKLNLLANSKRVGGCVGKATSGTFTCTYKPSVSGQLRLTATFAPTSPLYLASTSTPLNLNVVNRTTTR